MSSSSWLVGSLFLVLLLIVVSVVVCFFLFGTGGISSSSESESEIGRGRVFFLGKFFAVDGPERGLLPFSFAVNGVSSKASSASALC